ncbi:uncharacterized protein LOC102805012 [Saccoglossus kowalevskii]|uniref:Uncharacterized protein LOC102805012 n=1 Tax=Saccoglossus kowalevskii TaxID=10224 RepID=A0ABM0MAM0_SACKO|nr:PREDICTED: uncharacterized protein LOC102805012 [Saccoglossus kowalevskii]
MDNVVLRVEDVPPPAARLINVLCCSNKRNVTVLCDFNTVCITAILTKDGANTITVIKKLVLEKGEHAECTSWSPDGKVLVIAGRKLHVFNAQNDFKKMATCVLYYSAKDVSVSLLPGQLENHQYCIAVAGPNGVEIYKYIMIDDWCQIADDDVVPLHVELPIATLKYSSNSKYLAVAAMDGHFGVWKTDAEPMEEHKDFWFLHLKTLRITNIAFSEDSCKVGVSCWDGSFYVFQLVFGGDTYKWEPIKYHVNSPVEKVSGILPATLITWSHCDQYFSLCNSSDSGSTIYTFNIAMSTVITTVVCASDDNIKGIAVTQVNEEDCLVYITKNKKLGFLRLKSEPRCTERIPLMEVNNEWTNITNSAHVKLFYCDNSKQPVLKIKYCNAFLEWIQEFEGIGKCGSCHDAETSKIIPGLPSQEDKAVEQLNIKLSRKVANVCEGVVKRKSENTQSENTVRYEVITSAQAVGFLGVRSAHIYLMSTKSWRSVVFRSEVVKGCLCGGQWLVYITNDSVLSAHNLLESRRGQYHSEVTIDNPLSVVIVSSLTKPHCVMLDLDTHGSGYISEIQIAETLQVSRTQIYLPFMERATFTIVSSILLGQLIVLHQSSTEKSHDYCHVVVPGVGLYKSFPVEADQTMKTFCEQNKVELSKFQNLQ